ncbi:hypothetical protein [Gallaecimonas sp. GXIMD4217]|uniref:hypothetical protein n=1 Tax=Gallaecimonas sp. GXIMD4217 TaxID=3131927 RepID=UPI00311B1A9D
MMALLPAWAPVALVVVQLLWLGLWLLGGLRRRRLARQLAEREQALAAQGEQRGQWQRELAQQGHLLRDCQARLRDKDRLNAQLAERLKELLKVQLELEKLKRQAQ